MSMVAEAAAQQPPGMLAEAALAALCLGVAVPLLVRWVRAGPLDRPERVPPGGSAWPLVLALAWGMIVWMAVPAAYVAWRGPALRAGAPSATQSSGRDSTPPSTQVSTEPEATATRPTTRELVKPASPPGGALDLASLPPRDVAFLAAVPPLATLLALIAFDLTLYGGRLGRLGFARGQARTGLAAGAKLSIALVPLVFGAMVLTDWFYRWIRFEHPREHDLLKVLGESAEPVVRLALAAGAVVVAPLSEELMFRGHAQTILRAGLARLGGYRPIDPDGPAPSAPPAWATWGAIVLASALFAAVHDPWTWPPIFVLSLGLGWAYERTGNLWAPIAIHAAFNAVSTLIFLATQ